MSTLRILLQDTDPLRHEALPLRRRQHLRRVILAEATVERALAPAISRRRLAVLALVATAAIAGVWTAWSVSMPVQAAMRFEVRLAEEEPSPGLIPATVLDTDEVVYLHPEVIVANGDIALSTVVVEDTGHSVSVTFTPAGAEKMEQATSGHLGMLLAIVLDGEVLMAPRIRSIVSDSAVITGSFDAAEAERIALGISRP